MPKERLGKEACLRQMEKSWEPTVDEEPVGHYRDHLELRKDGMVAKQRELMSYCGEESRFAEVIGEGPFAGR